MKNFIKKHKKSCIIGGILILLFLVFFVIVFIMPLFSNNKYGDRLEDIETHEVSKNTLNEITDKLKENEGVEKASYHKEGRILNFIVTVKNDTALDKAKAYTNVVTDTLSKMPEDNLFNKLAEFFKILGDTTRAKILFALVSPITPLLQNFKLDTRVSKSSSNIILGLGYISHKFKAVLQSILLKIWL